MYKIVETLTTMYGYETNEDAEIDVWCYKDGENKE